jgi:branched-chain amino acid transport system substrate-binding protein
MKTKARLSRRTLLQGTTATGLAFFGPWKHNHVWAQKAEKPILIGLTFDATGQFGNAGQDEMRGALMALDEANEKGGVLGRKLAYIHADTETTPATGTRVAERMITRNEVAFLVGAIQSGVANAIGQVAQKYGTVYFNTNSSSPTEAGKDCHRVKFVWEQRDQLRHRRRQGSNQQLRQALAAAHQRLCVGTQHVEVLP